MKNLVGAKRAAFTSLQNVERELRQRDIHDSLLDTPDLDMDSRCFGKDKTSNNNDSNVGVVFSLQK